MKVIIIGAGFTGVQLARALIAEGGHVVLIDNDPDKVQHARNALDCAVIEADGNSPETLEEAGIASVDALVTLTDDDEINMITCSLVDASYPDVLKIARVRNYAYYTRTAATARRRASGTDTSRRPLFGIDRMLNPDVEAAAAICRAMAHGAVGNVIELGGDYCITALTVEAGSMLADASLRSLAARADWNYLVAYVENAEGATLPDGGTVLRAGDRIGVLSSLDALPELMKAAGCSGTDHLHTMAIFGADRIGTLVADYQLKSRRVSAFARVFGTMAPRKRDVIIVDRDAERCREAAEHFAEASVLCGDVTDADLIRDEALDESDLMVAASGNYERNLVIAAYLKSRGVKRTIALTASGEFDDVARKLGVDVAVPMRDTVVDSIISHLRGKSVKSIHTVCNRMFEIVECDISAAGRAAGKSLQELAPNGAYLVLLVRDPGIAKFKIPNGTTVLQAGGRAVLAVRAGDNQVIRLFGGKV